jgi:hypothetical protein
MINWKRSWPNLRSYPDIFQEELREKTETWGRAVSATTQTQVRSFAFEPIHLILIEILIFETSHPIQPTNSRWWSATHRLRNTVSGLLICYVLSSQVGWIPDSARCASIRFISWPCRLPSQLFYWAQQSPLVYRLEVLLYVQFKFPYVSKRYSLTVNLPNTLLQSVNTLKTAIRLSSI